MIADQEKKGGYVPKINKIRFILKAFSTTSRKPKYLKRENMQELIYVREQNLYLFEKRETYKDILNKFQVIPILAFCIKT